ncbi:MAG: hypothetical protein IPP18_07885 [Rhodocyclaceae bacterium]|nr:hypothetical protein [Rhodocyclaceae bacterium]
MALSKMQAWLPSLCLLCVVTMASAQNLPLKNGDFQQPMIDGSLPGWRLEQHAGDPAYEMKVVPDESEPGNSIFCIRRTKNEAYGLIGQEMPLTNIPTGKEVELLARMKTKAVGPDGWVLMLDMIGKVHRTLPTSILRQVRSSPLSGDRDWQTVSVRTVIPDSTTLIGISATLLDAGTGCIDNVRVRLIQ